MTYQIHIGDCIDSMKSMSAQSVHTCVTSPPYFGLRDYGMNGQIGLDDTPDAFVARLVDVFREVRRVLRDDGTLWLNLGDSYASAWSMPGGRRNVVGQGSLSSGKRADRPNRLVGGLKEKDLIGIPWRVAFALQADGWYLRQDIIWHKPNPMPESVTDRCTKAHEYVFLLSKGPKYYFDNMAIKEPAVQAGRVRADRMGGNKYCEGVKHSDGSVFTGSDIRNRRSVWTVSTKPFKDAHFATFPPDLIEPCILAGAPLDGVVLDPFGGSGTTAGVAIKHGRRAVLCELNPEYAALVPARIKSIAGNTPDMFRERSATMDIIEKER